MKRGLHKPVLKFWLPMMFSPSSGLRRPLRKRPGLLCCRSWRTVGTSRCKARPTLGRATCAVQDGVGLI